MIASRIATSPPTACSAVAFRPSGPAIEVAHSGTFKVNMKHKLLGFCQAQSCRPASPSPLPCPPSRGKGTSSSGHGFLKPSETCRLSLRPCPKDRCPENGVVQKPVWVMSVLAARANLPKNAIADVSLGLSLCMCVLARLWTGGGGSHQ